MGITVVYRLCDIPSTNPPPIYKNDKRRLNELCLRKFIEAFDGVDYQIHYLCDHTDNYDELLKITPVPYKTEYSNEGINYTYMRSLELGLEYETDMLFQECDYYYLRGTGQSVVNAIHKFGFMSPYDHPDKYPGDAKMRLFDGRHWRSAISTTMTYGVRKDKLKEHYETLTRHGYLDHQMWVELGARGETLWTPIPTIATHMVEDYLAPNIDWKTIFHQR